MANTCTIVNVVAIRSEDVPLVRSESILTRTQGFLYGFTHTLNPYMGCAFGDGGCGIYCYVAESPIGLYAGKPWGQWLRAKANAADALRRDLKGQPHLEDVRVFMSSATDPYQPAESKLRITRSVLEVFPEQRVGLLVVQTRCPLVERDFDLLADMPFVWLSMTVETDDDGVRRALTPTCPSIGRRFLAMQRARSMGIRVQAAVSPTLPYHLNRFTDLLAESADRVIVDTFFGDGTNGRRTSHRPLPRRFTELGYGDWRDSAAARALFEELSLKMGAERVGWSQDGFNRLALDTQVL
jgi:DNA repair photolyase